MSKPSSRGNPLGAIVHVHDPAPNDTPAVDAKRVAPIDVIVDEGREQIVGGGDSVEIAGEMEVYILHRNDLGVTAAGGAAFHAEAGPK